jgi:tRNA-dependent cyclodipeptide synthase
VRIKQITELASDALENKQKYKAFMGISLNNKFFSKKVMRQYIRWCSKQFSETLILIMDDPERYNYIVLDKMPVWEATDKSRDLGLQLKASYEKILIQFEIPNVKIVLFSEFWKDAEFERINNLVEKECQRNVDFKNDSMESTRVWIGKRVSADSFSEAELNTLNKHIREELASLFYLTEKGYVIELDPTPELSTKKKVYEDEFEELSKDIGITDRGHIYLCPEDSEWYSGAGSDVDKFLD